MPNSPATSRNESPGSGKKASADNRRLGLSKQPERYFERLAERNPFHKVVRLDGACDLCS
jgi:hypothetical protein